MDAFSIAFSTDFHINCSFGFKISLKGIVRFLYISYILLSTNGLYQASLQSLS